MAQRTAVLILACLAGFRLAPMVQAKTAVPFQPAAGATHIAQLMPSPGYALPLAQTSPPPSAPNPAPNAAAADQSSPVLLSPGTSSDDVKLLQRQLQELGFYSGPIDGLYGLPTQQSVQAYQQRQNLPPTGVLDQATWTLMSTPQLFATSPENPATELPDSPANTAPSSAVTATDANPPSENTSPAAAPSAATTETPLPSPNASPAMPGGSMDPGAGLPETSPPSESTPAAAENQPNRFLFFGLLLLVATSVAAIAAFWLWRRPAASGEASLDPSGTPTNDLSPAVDSSYRADPGKWVAPAANAAATSPEIADQPANTSRLARIDILDELIGDLEKPDPKARHHAIWELGQRGNSNAIQPLVNAMIDADSKERSLILAALSEIGTRTMKPMQQALAMSLQDQNPEVRKNAIRDLMRVYDLMAQMGQLLNHAAHDSHPEVQQTAQWAMERLSHIRQLPPSKSASSSMSAGLSAHELRPDESSTFNPRRLD